MSIVFQPVIDLRLGRIAGAEALARFATTPVRTPDLWFNEAWEVGLGVELELIAIRQALASLGSLPEGCHLAINASPETLVSPLLDAVLDGFPGDRLIVELTEHAQVDDYSNVKTATERLRARGIRLAIDDAGAGFSSLQHILHLRPDLIKLDRSLTQGIDGDPVRYALAAALVTFALSLEAEICGEGIEKDAELAALQHLGIAYGQGYFLGCPGPSRSPRRRRGCGCPGAPRPCSMSAPSGRCAPRALHGRTRRRRRRCSSSMPTASLRWRVLSSSTQRPWKASTGSRAGRLCSCGPPSRSSA